jgi:hypothetical protein
VCRSAREKPYRRAAPSEYRVDTANGQDNDDAQTRTGELWASYATRTLSSLKKPAATGKSSLPAARLSGFQGTAAQDSLVLAQLTVWVRH